MTTIVSPSSHRNTSSSRLRQYHHGNVCRKFVLNIIIIGNHKSKIIILMAFFLLWLSTNHNTNNLYYDNDINNAVVNRPMTSNTFKNNNTTTNDSCIPFYPTKIPKFAFYPVEFFTKGAGKLFLEDYHRRGASTAHVRFTMYQKTSFSSSCQQQALYYHIHKCGGTTMNDLRSDNWRIQQQYNKQLETTLGMAAYNATIHKTLGKVNSNHYHHRHIVIHNTTATYIPVFTFIRDPVKRFMSSINEILKDSTKFHSVGECIYNKNLLLAQFQHKYYTIWNHDNSEHYIQQMKQMINCLLQKLEDPNASTYYNSHLVPQSYELLAGMGHYPRVGIDLLDLRYLSQVTKQMGELRQNFTSNVGSSIVDNGSGNFINTIVANYVPSSIWPFLQIDDFANVILPFQERICKLYQMDVFLLKEYHKETGTKIQTFC